MATEDVAMDIQNENDLQEYAYHLMNKGARVWHDLDNIVLLDFTLSIMAIEAPNLATRKCIELVKKYLEDDSETPIHIQKLEIELIKEAISDIDLNEKIDLYLENALEEKRENEAESAAEDKWRKRREFLDAQSMRNDALVERRSDAA